MADSNVPESSTGRFTVVSLPPVVSVESLNRCLEKISDHFWLALDMSRVERMEAGVVDGLARLAQRCREGGGRLCVVLSDARLRHRLKVDGLDRDLDVLSDWSELEPAGRRLSAGCERSLLLETVVRREGRS
jgi:anti-anti-sigma regulatory factor